MDARDVRRQSRKKDKIEIGGVSPRAKAWDRFHIPSLWLARLEASHPVECCGPTRQRNQRKRGFIVLNISLQGRCTFSNFIRQRWVAGQTSEGSLRLRPNSPADRNIPIWL
jgi:hypothetical protein